jgi:Pathogenicity locus
MQAPKCAPPLHLSDLRNIGPAGLGDFAVLGIESVAQLSMCEPGRLFLDLQRLTDKRQDPCVYDVFAAAIHQAKTGEAKNWWAFTSERKVLQQQGGFPFDNAG